MQLQASSARFMELMLGTRDGLDVSSSGMFRGIPASPVHEKVLPAWPFVLENGCSLFPCRP